MTKLLMLTSTGQNLWEWIGANPAILVTLLILLATTMFTIFAKTIITIFKMGVLFKEELATKRDQLSFERKIVQDLRDYKDELMKVVMATSMNTINDKLKSVDDVQDLVSEMKTLEATLEIKVKNAMEKVDEVRGMAENVRILTNKVNRLEYGSDNQEVRRKESK
jgi:hypothetical protein